MVVFGDRESYRIALRGKFALLLVPTMLVACTSDLTLGTRAQGDDAAQQDCGDRRLEAPEECDDGNRLSGDGCSSECFREVSPTCGNRDVEYENGEECDDGNEVEGDGCSSECFRETPSTCGNGELDLNRGEQCDDGELLPGDGCSPSCQYEPVGAFCGDGQEDTLELCDDRNTENGDGCNPTCNFRNTTSAVAGEGDDFGEQGALVATQDSIWFADSNNYAIKQIEVSTGEVSTRQSNGPEPFGLVKGLATDGDTLWFSSPGYLRAMDIGGAGTVTTVAGQGSGDYAEGIGTSARFRELSGIVYYGGLVYFVDGNAAVLGSFDPQTGEVRTLAGVAGGSSCGIPINGVGSLARFCAPTHLASDNSGNIFISELEGQAIRKYNTVTGEVTTFVGTGQCSYADGVGFSTRLARPGALSSDGTSLYFVEESANTIRQVVLATGQLSTMIGEPRECALTCSCLPGGGNSEGVGRAATLHAPKAITYHHATNSLYFFDGGNQRIRRVQ